MVNTSGIEIFEVDNLSLEAIEVDSLDKNFVGQRTETTVVSVYKSKDGTMVEKTTIIPRNTVFEKNKNSVTYRVM